MKDSHLPTPESSFSAFSFGELFVEGERSMPFTFLYQNATLKRDIPPFKKGTKIATARFDASKGYFYLAVDKARYYYQARMQFVPIHKPMKGLPCAACMQFERTSTPPTTANLFPPGQAEPPSDICLFCKSASSADSKETNRNSSLLERYEDMFGPLNETCGEEKGWHKW